MSRMIIKISRLIQKVSKDQKELSNSDNGFMSRKVKNSHAKIAQKYYDIISGCPAKRTLLRPIITDLVLDF